MLGKRYWLSIIPLVVIVFLTGLISRSWGRQAQAQYPTIPEITSAPTPTPIIPTHIITQICKGTNVTQVVCPATGGTNRLYVVTAANRGTSTVSAVSGLGLSWTKRRTQCSANSASRMDIWTAFGSPANGNVTINYGVSVSEVVGSVSGYSGADPANPVQNWAGSNTLGQNDTTCTGGVNNTNSLLTLTSTTPNSVLFAATDARNTTIQTADPDYTQRATDFVGVRTRLYIHDRMLAVSGSDNVNHLFSGNTDWVMNGLAIRPAPQPTSSPTPTQYQIYGWLYNETNNNINRSTAASEGLIGGIGINLYGTLYNSTTSQNSQISGILGNYRFSNTIDGIYTVELLSEPANSVPYLNYTNPQMAIVAGSEVIVDFPYITITPTYQPGTPTPTPPGGGLPENTPTPTLSGIAPTAQVTPTSAIEPPTECQTLPTPDLQSPEHDVCLNFKPDFSAYVEDPNGDNVWAHFFLSNGLDVNGNSVIPSGDSVWTPGEMELNQTESFWWSAITQSSSCPDSGQAPSRLLSLDYTPPEPPDPPVCTLDYQNYVTGESFFTCTWFETVSEGCANTVNYHPYFWTSTGESWDPGWIGDQTSITVVVEDGQELYAEVATQDSAGNISEKSDTGGSFTAPRINYGNTPTPGGPTAVPPSPTVTPTPTLGAWLQILGGDIYQPVINQPVPSGKYFLDLLPTPVENPYSAGLIWSNSGSGNYGLGSSAPIDWEVPGTFTNAYSFSYYWESLKNKAKSVNNNVIGVINAPAEVTPAPLAISNLAVNDMANAVDWHIKSNLQTGDTQFGDRTYVLNSIPAEFLGAAWVQSANDSRAYTTEPLVTFEVNIDVTAYVAHESTITPKPAWLSGWTDTGFYLVNSENIPKNFRLYAKEFPAGTVTVGTNGATGKSMYTVIVLPNVSAPTPTPEGSGDLDEQNSVYAYLGSGLYTLDPSFDGNRTAGPDVTVMLVSGTMEISDNFSLADPEDIVVFIVNGYIQIGANVSRIPGLYISSQTISIASSDLPIIIDGMLYAKRFNFARTFIDQNIPTYQFIYQPGYLVKLLPFLGRSRVNWQDLSP